MATTLRKETPVVMRVGNSRIEIGKKYALDPKPDPSAPKGLKDYTKLPFAGNTTTECIFFHEEARRYDTCFYKESLSLTSAVPDVKERENLVNIYEKHIKKPYEEKFYKNLEPSEGNTFWQDYRIEIYENKQFDTNDTQDLLDLFLLLWSGAICEKDERNPQFRKTASYVINSSENQKNKEKEKTKERKTAWKIFDSLIDADRDKLNLTLQWMGEDDQSNVDGEDLSSIYYNVINLQEKGLDFATRFNIAVKEYETPEGLEKMEYFYAINRLLKKRVIKKTTRGYIEDGSEVWLGNTLTDIATACLTTTSQQHQIINKLIDTNPDVRRETPEHLKPNKVK